jgi:hypothetical protein
MNQYRQMEIKYIVNENGCHICTSHCLNTDGYAIIVRGGKPQKLHRYMLEKYLGRKLKEGMNCLHKCNTPSCINPEHLYDCGSNNYNKKGE